MARRTTTKEADGLRARIEELRARTQDATMPEVLAETKRKELGPIPKLRRMLQGHYGKVYAMHWAGDSQHLVSASQDGKLIIWNAQTTHKIQAIPLRSAWVMTCAYERTHNRLVACGGLDNLCSVYQLGQVQAMRPDKELGPHDGYLSCCRFVDSSSIISSSGDSTCIYWDVETGDAKVSFTEHGGDAMSVSVCPTNKSLFVSGSCDSTAKLWDVRTGRCAMTFDGHLSDINAVDFMSNGTCFGTGSDDSTCRLFDLRSYSQLAEFQTVSITCGITSVSFSSSGRLLFAGYDDFHCYAWDVLASDPSKHAYNIQKHHNRVSCLGVCPSGHALCTGSWDTTLMVWAQA